ncbi:hypothetical protein V2J09_000696 [Rumex salicifolius]
MVYLELIMDRRNWPWRKKSSEKSPGETESSGSISDEQANLAYNSQSPEAASTNAPDDEENEKINALTDKLSAALLTINLKEDLVKQHAKVAEEAVAGWERAEKEASSFKLQLDAALKKNSALDGALKECVRQLRQGKEEREQRIEDGIAKREQEWESRKSELEIQLNELSTQLEAAKSRATHSTSIDDLLPKLEAAEKENSYMRVELVGLSKKLEIASIERDLSTQSAETASKQQLESVKKVAKLEAECRRLRFLARKVSLSNDHRPVTASSANADSLTDSQSDCGERLNALETESNQSDREFDQLKGVRGLERNPVSRSSERVLMDDFLEMERLVAFPDTSNGPVTFEVAGPSNMTGENPLKAEIEEMITRNADLEKNIRRLEAEKLDLEKLLDKSQGELKNEKVRSVELEDQLSECEAQLRASHGQLKATKTELISLQTHLYECQDQLRKSQARLTGTETELIELQTQLIEHEDLLNYSGEHLKDADAKLEEMKTQLIERDDQLSMFRGQLNDAKSALMELKMKLMEREEQLKTSQAQADHAEDELRKLQARLFECEVKIKTSQGQLEDAEKESIELKAQLLKSEEELKRSQGQVRNTDSQLLEMQARLIEYEEKLEKSQGQTKDVDTKLVELQTELDLANKLKDAVEGEIKASNARREEAELQVKALESEVKSLIAKVESKVDESGKRDLSAEMKDKCKMTEDEPYKTRLEPQFELAWRCNTDMKAEQEKELAVAASKLEECQKTIASLGRQLQSLATLDDFLEDADSSLEFSGESPIFFRTGDLGRPPSIDCQ